MFKKFTLIAALVLSSFLVLPSTAKADVGFSFGFSNGRTSITIGRSAFIDPRFGFVDPRFQQFRQFNSFNAATSLDLAIARQRDRVRRAAFLNNRALLQLELNRLRNLEAQRFLLQSRNRSRIRFGF